LINGLDGYRMGGLGMCSDDNLGTPVRAHHVARVLWRNGIRPGKSLTKCIVRTELGWIGVQLPLLPSVKSMLLNIARPMWHFLPISIRNIIYPR
ncbi:MAG: hypothetical protein JWO45_1094, partial [Spartobacteria bacterium]|nr:hypothetical protein [Spartobacteria bacterium]